MTNRVEWLVQELEEGNVHLRLQVSAIRKERDALQREVAAQRRLMGSCVKEVSALQTELSRLSAAQLHRRLGWHVAQMEHEVAKEDPPATKVEDTPQHRRLTEQLKEAERQGEKDRCRILSLEKELESIFKQKATEEENSAKEIEQLKAKLKEAEEKAKSAASDRQRLTVSRREQERLTGQLTLFRHQLTDKEKQVNEKISQLAEAQRSVEAKTAQIAALRKGVQEAKASAGRLEKDLADTVKQVESLTSEIAKKDDIIKKQKLKSDEVAKDLNKLKSLLSKSDLPGICQCNEEAAGVKAKELLALRGGEPLPACPAGQLRQTIDSLKKQLETATEREKRLESDLECIRLQLPHMTAEADRTYTELQTMLEKARQQAKAAELHNQEHHQRNRQLLLKLAAETSCRREAEQKLERLVEEARQLREEREERGRCAAELRAAQAELAAERSVAEQLRRRLDSADAQTAQQLKAMTEELQEIKQSAGRPVDWARRYEQLLDRWRRWQEESLARQRDCLATEQRLRVGLKQRHQPARKTGPQAAAADRHWAAARSDPSLVADRRSASTSSGSIHTAAEPTVSPIRSPSAPGGSGSQCLSEYNRQHSQSQLAASSQRSTPQALQQTSTQHSRPQSQHMAPLPSQTATRSIHSSHQVPPSHLQASSSSHQVSPPSSVWSVCQEESRPAQQATSSSCQTTPPFSQQSRPRSAQQTASPASHQSHLRPRCQQASPPSSQRAAPPASGQSERTFHSGPPPALVAAVQRQKEQHMAERYSLLLAYKASQERLQTAQMVSAASRGAARPAGVAADASRSENSGTSSGDGQGSQLAELRDQWRRLETIARGEMDARSDVVLRLSGVSETGLAFSDVS